MNISKWVFIPNSIKRKILQIFRYELEPFIYVALGDSTAEGMGASMHEKTYTSIIATSLKDRYRQVDYQNFARSGAVLSDVIEHQLPKVLKINPSLITISIGANDIIRRTKLEEFETNLQHLLRTLQQKTDATVVISTIPDLSLTPAVPKLLKTYSRYKAGKLNTIIRNIGRMTGTVTVDMFEDSRAVLKSFPEAIASDGFHPSDFGYALWANTILVTLRNVLAPVAEEKQTEEIPDP
ncbi:MAG TPA: SGNH/GDSL hydrolase family protein [Patescibacteria group bacterium]|nr:SGNH/GDSL hydrolase family protein [Patescibacteria group bacterium]